MNDIVVAVVKRYAKKEMLSQFTKEKNFVSVIKMKKGLKLGMTLLFLLGVALLVGCSRSSERAAYNLDIEAEEFQLSRRIAAVNGITDKPIFEIVGQCSIETTSSYVSGMLEIICKTGHNKFSKHFVYLSDNVLIIVEQLDAVDVPQYHYQIQFTPQALLPIPKIVGGSLGDRAKMEIK